MKKNLGPLTKPPKKLYELSPHTKVVLKQLAVGVSVFSLFALLIAGVYHLTRLPALSISNVTVVGSETIDPTEVKARAERVLEGAYGALIPRRFFLFYPQTALLAEVERVERIRDVTIDRTSRNELVITYSEHIPFALWCDASATSTCLFLNDEGYAFAEAPDLSGGSFVRYYHAATAPAVGTTLTTQKEFWNTVSFIQLLAVDGLFVTTVEIDAVQDVYYGLSKRGQLRAALADDPARLAENLRTVLGAKEFAHLRDADFHYIDLRFGNKVYVSEVDVSLSKASSTATSSADISVTEPSERTLTNE